ncbi:hypothetical protein P3S67_004714 [Capsicum chacoense]
MSLSPQQEKVEGILLFVGKIEGSSDYDYDSWVMYIPNGEFLSSIRCGCILWFEKQKEGSMLEVALDNEALKKFFWVVNTDKEEHSNTMVSVQLYSNLEDKILIEGGRIVMNLTKMEVLFAKMLNYIWDPEKMSIYSRGI